MILAIDIGNLGTTIALFQEDGTLSFQSELGTDLKMTDDRCAIDLMGVFQLYRAELSNVKGSILSSVVPNITAAYLRTLRRLTGRSPLVVGPGLRPPRWWPPGARPRRSTATAAGRSGMITTCW